MIPQPILDFFVQKLLAPLLVEALILIINRRVTDPVFKTKTDALFSDLARASTPQERSADAKDLQALIHS